MAKRKSTTPTSKKDVKITEKKCSNPSQNNIKSSPLYCILSNGHYFEVTRVGNRLGSGVRFPDHKSAKDYLETL